MKIIPTILIYLLLIIIDRKELKRNKQKMKGFLVYYSLLSFGFIISVLLAVDKAPPSPAEIIDNIIIFLMNRGG